MLPTLAGVEAALKAIRPYQPETPLVRSTILSRSFRADVWLKNETVSPISSFKIRGALHALMRAQSQAQPAVAVTSSTGNHGQAVAWAAAQLGLTAEIFLPEACNPVKKAMIRALEARLHEGGGDIDEAKDRARNHRARPGHVFVDDGESLDLMEGAPAMAESFRARQAVEGQTVLLVLTGSNIAPSVLQRAMGHDSLLAPGGV